MGIDRYQGRPSWGLNTVREDRIAKDLADEKRRADDELAHKWANREMPEDIRSRARAWGLEAFITVLWSNAFMAGYREAMRDRADQS